MRGQVLEGDILLNLGTVCAWQEIQGKPSIFSFKLFYVHWEGGRHLPSRGKLTGSKRYNTAQTHNKLAHGPKPHRENDSFRSKKILALHQWMAIGNKLFCNRELLFSRGSWQLTSKLHIYSNLLKFACKIMIGNSWGLLLFHVTCWSLSLVNYVVYSLTHSVSTHIGR